MSWSLTRNIRNVDWLLALPIFFLMAVGLSLMYSISINPVDPNPALFQRQVVYAALGIVIFFSTSSLNYRLWPIYSKVIYIAGLLILGAVLFFGVTIRGTTGWISVGFGTFQPVEFVKIGLIIFLAKYFSDHGRMF